MLRPVIPWPFLVTVLATMCFLNCSGPGGVQEKELPNIVLISLDTLRADHLSSFGGQHVRTPNIDSIGQGGDKVDEFYCPLALDQVELWFAFHFTLSFPTRIYDELKVGRR